MSRILIIEDNSDVREDISEILSLAGHQVFETDNGRSGVDIAIKNIPDIILCDIMMPDLDGYGVLYMLGKYPETAMIPFIFITAKADRADVRKGMEMGADDYLVKPFDDVELLSAIEGRLRKKGIQQIYRSQSLEKLNKLVSNETGLSELAKIIQDQKCRTFRKKQIIHHEGDKVIGLYIIIEGKVKTIMLGEDGRELLTGIFEADEFLSINVLLSNETYTDTATALEDSVLCFIPKKQLDDLLYMYPDLAANFIKILSHNIREKEIYLLQLAYQSVRKRIAEAIIRLFRQRPSIGESIKVTRDDLAAMSGSASETVSRTLTEFTNEGLIERAGSSLKIIDMPRMVNLKN